MQTLTLDEVNSQLRVAAKPLDPVPVIDTLLTAQELWEEESGRADWEAERAHERALEDRGWAEAMLQRQMEDARGVIQFEDAMEIAFGPRIIGQLEYAD
jgi:hypothetical protein